MNVEIVTLDVKKLKHLQDIRTQTGQKNEQLKNGLNLKKIWWKSYRNPTENIRV